MIVNALFALLQAQVPGLAEHRVSNIFRPLATPGTAEKNIAVLTLAITGAIFIVVGGLIVYTMWRFRRKSDDTSRQEPAQVYGSNQTCQPMRPEALTPLETRAVRVCNASAIC